MPIDHFSRLLVLLVVLATLSSSAADTNVTEPPAGEVYNPYPLPATATSAYTLTNETLESQLRSVATKDKVVIFTTLRAGDGPTDELMGMLSNFCYWLHRRGLLRHAMLLTTDEGTWRALHQRGLPAWLDRVFPRRQPYITAVRVGDSYNREFDVQKHWWGMRLVQLGYHVLYSDSDAVFMQNPLGPFRQPWDVQALSDWFEPELFPTGGAAEHTCNDIYWWVKEDRLPLGAALRERWHLEEWSKGGGRDSALRVINPCASTGLWYLQPTNITARFMQALVDRIAWHAVWEWDQTAFNDVIMAYLWGMGEDSQLRFRLLPVSQYSNVGVQGGRRKEGLSVDQVVLHAGAVPGSQKIVAFKELGLWHGDFTQDEGRPYFSTPPTPPKRTTAVHPASLAALALSMVLLAGFAVYWWQQGPAGQQGQKQYVSVLPVLQPAAEPAAPAAAREHSRIMVGTS